MKQLPISVTNNLKSIYRVVAIDGDFLIMTYKEKYYEIINSGYKTKPENVYTEKHHIIPRSVCILLDTS